MKDPIPQDLSLIPIARRLRKNMTKSEHALWARLRNRQLCGYKFRRQHVLLRYVVDFYCTSVRLAVEVDGISHETKQAARSDAKRQTALERHGVTVLRFTSRAVLDDTDNVLLGISGVLDDLTRAKDCS